MIGVLRLFVVWDGIGAKRGGAEDSPGMGPVVWREKTPLA